MTAELTTSPHTQPASVAAPRRHTVLIIDDDHTLAEVLSHGLRQQGFRTAAAHSGAAGLRKAKEEPPSAVILDLGLPDADGLTICAQLADSAETCAIPIIVLSGTDRPDIVRRCRTAGSHYFLRKPHDPSALLVLVRQAICETSDWSVESGE
jgi:DNA-binding response OmpR family regulator